MPSQEKVIFLFPPSLTFVGKTQEETCLNFFLVALRICSQAGTSQTSLHERCDIVTTSKAPVTSSDALVKNKQNYIVSCQTADFLFYLYIHGMHSLIPFISSYSARSTTTFSAAFGMQPSLPTTRMIESHLAMPVPSQPLPSH